MIAVICIAAATCALMIAGVLFFPQIKIGKLTLSTYWLITLLGAIALIASCQADVVKLGKSLVADTAVNPLKILVLFISMTVLSVFLDELGFFGFLASAVLKRAKSGQKKLFFSLYAAVSLLTIVTSNDIIVLSFTPFICYFAKNAKIDPVPYLAAEFVAANTWSMLLIIGNPTNIYLATACGVDFVTYVKYSIFPTLFAGTASLGALWIMFRKKLSAPITGEADDAKIGDRLQLWVGIAHLAVCTVLLAISSYIGLEMWLIALCSAASLALFALVIAAARRQKPRALGRCLMRAPWQLIPFVLSMFVLIAGLEQKGVTAAIGGFLGTDFAALKYGVSSFFAANLINNIPMSVLFSSIISSVEGAGIEAVFATVIGSNLGAYFTPIGALAGIMWTKILNTHGLKFGYTGFLKIGVFVAIPALFAAIGGLYLSLFLFA